jgi:hypothetical protein
VAHSLSYSRHHLPQCPVSFPAEIFRRPHTHLLLHSYIRWPIASAAYHSKALRPPALRICIGDSPSRRSPRASGLPPSTLDSTPRIPLLFPFSRLSPIFLRLFGSSQKLMFMSLALLLGDLFTELFPIHSLS